MTVRWLCLLTLVVVVPPSRSALGAERVLLPIATPGQHEGSHGSVWETTVAISNDGTAEGYVTGVDPHCRVGHCDPSVPVQPNQTLFPYLLSLPDGVQGRILILEETGGARLTVSARTTDVSRNATWGTTIPMVRQRDAFSASFSLNDLPGAGDFRVAVRVYTFDPAIDTKATIRVWITDARSVEPSKRRDEMLDEFTLVFPNHHDPEIPGYSAFMIDHDVDEHERLRVEIIPESDLSTLWAFASITHNETQHVTIVAP